MLHDKTKSAQERLDYGIALLNDPEHDCKDGKCQICFDKMELAEEIRQENNQAASAELMPNWEFDETELMNL